MFPDSFKIESAILIDGDKRTRDDEGLASNLGQTPVEKLTTRPFSTDACSASSTLYTTICKQSKHMYSSTQSDAGHLPYVCLIHILSNPGQGLRQLNAVHACRRLSFPAILINAKQKDAASRDSYAVHQKEHNLAVSRKKQEDKQARGGKRRERRKENGW
jgi:hypothetical protein